MYRLRKLPPHNSTIRYKYKIIKPNTNKWHIMVRQRVSQRLKRAYFRIYQTSSTYIKHAIEHFFNFSLHCDLYVSIFVSVSARRCCFVYFVCCFILSLAACSHQTSSPSSTHKKQQQHKSL